MINKIINQKNLAWTSKSILLKDQRFQLSEQTVSEIENSGPSLSLKKSMEEVKKRHLDNGPGFVIISGLKIHTNNSLKNAIEKISLCLGRLISQNSMGDKIIEVKDEGKTLENGGRYHTTRSGGSLHTDAPQYPLPSPKYLCTLCVRPAKSGGKSLLVSSYTLHNELFKLNKEILKRLYQNFYFEKRDDSGVSKNSTLSKPIFRIENSLLQVHYLREYINQGYSCKGKQMTSLEVAALNAIDDILENPSFNVSYRLKAGELLISDNWRVLHGRTSFEDWEAHDKKRLLFRTWIDSGGL